ncbi:tetratricopeptide repeat protein [Solimonas marina]|uniref:Tetratricopeptide repeat protein n=1 Tax=Solimonas marina TaxID=2714601 RepID=A0A970B802_9GAMM|nr:hypothetical protein [Solimonas marina]NKF20931.1 hypothetical protein [Solimonas marina]
MRTLFVLACLCLAACTTVPTRQQTDSLLDDAAYGQPPDELQQLNLFAISPAMHQFVAREVAKQMRLHGDSRGLYAAIRTQLHIDYDASTTRPAAQTFITRSGNCLSLVILTAALARDAGVAVHFQYVPGEGSWTRFDGVIFRNGHVNIALDSRKTTVDGRSFGSALIVDFLPSVDLEGLRTVEISERRILAMYMSNRAGENFADGDVDAAYWWARAALDKDPSFSDPYNTLGVIHRQRGELQLAERSFRMALTIRPDNAVVLSNLIGLLTAQGRETEADPLRQTLARIEPVRPYAYLDAGNAALAAGDAKLAMHYFREELQRMPYNADVHYAMAVAAARLDRLTEAGQFLASAAVLSPNLSDRQIYASKLEKLRALSTN